MLDQYSFIIAWLCQDGKWVSSRRPMVLTLINKEYVTLQHIRDQDCSIDFPAQSEPLFFTLHLIAFPKGLKDWMRQLHEPQYTSSLIHITKIQYEVQQELCGQRFTMSGPPDLSFYIHEYKNRNGEKMIFLDTPEITYRKDALENQLLSTIEV